MLGEDGSDTERAAKAAIRAMPGWEDATIAYRRAVPFRSVPPVMSPVHRAVDSDCWALDVDGGFYFLKIVHPEMRDAVDVTTSFAAAQMAAKAGVAPVVHHRLPEHHAIVFNRLEEPCPTRPPPTASASSTRRPGVARPSSSSTSSAGITGAGSRR